MGSTCQGTTPPKAKGKNISESTLSPATVERMARSEKPRPFGALRFMRLIT